MLPLPNQKSSGRGRKRNGQKLSRDVIIETSLKIIDRDGIENFSMRNLALELGTYPTAIYWHIPNRNALIGEVIAHVLTGLVPESMDTNWKQGILDLCRNYRERVKKHPGLAPIIGAQLVSNESIDFDMLERILSGLKLAGFAGPELRAAYNAVIAAMVGFTTQEFALVPEADDRQWASAMKQTVSDINKETHPISAENIDNFANKAFIVRWENGVSSPLDDGFELFINAFVNGLETMLNEKKK